MVANVLLEAPDDESLAVKVFAGEVVGVGDGGCVQHVHEAGEAARPSVVGSRRQHDQRVRPPGQQAGEPAAERTRAPVRHVVRFVDHDHVPVRLLQVGPVLGVLLERVDGDDRLVVVVERVVVGGNPPPDALDADRVQPRERDREAVPELLLELGQHALERQHQNPAAPSARNQFADQDAGLERLPQPDGVCDQDALAGLAQRLAGRFQLVVHRVHGAEVAHVDARVAGDGLAQQALHVQAAVGELGRRVGHEARAGRVQHFDLWFQLRQKDGFAFPHELRDAVAHQLAAPVRSQVHAPHHPLGVPNLDASAGREGKATARSRALPRDMDRDRGRLQRSSDTNRITRTDCTPRSSVSTYAMSPSGPKASGIGRAFVSSVPT